MRGEPHQAWAAPSFWHCLLQPPSLSPGLFLLTSCDFPHETCHIHGLSNFLRSPLHLQLHSHNLMHCPLTDTLSGLSGLLKLEWKALDLITLAFYVPPNPASHRGHSLPSVGKVSGLPWVMASEWLDG